MTALMYNTREEEPVNQVKTLRRFFDQKVRPMPQQSLLAMKVAFGLRAQYSTIMMLASLLVVQVIGVFIFAGNARAVGTISFLRSTPTTPYQMNYAYSVTTDPSSNIYVYRSWSTHKIFKLDSAGNYLTSFGSNGSGDGQFGEVRDMATDSSGNLYIVENDRVQKFNSAGVYQAKWGATGSGLGEFNEPSGITVDSAGHVYVADTRNHRIQRFDSDGTNAIEWGATGSGLGEFNDPRDVAITSTGRALVLDSGNERVQAFSSTGTDPTQWSYAPSLFSDYVIKFALDSSDNVYIPDQSGYAPDNNNKIIKFDASGTKLIEIGGTGTGDGKFVTTSGFQRDIAVSSSNSILVTDYDNARVQQFAADGTFESQFGVRAHGHFSGPSGVATDSSGNVYVADVTTARVQKFNSSGTFVLEWGAQGSGDGQFSLALNRTMNDIKVAPNGYVYVLDRGNRRVQKFTSAGIYSGQFAWVNGSGDGQVDALSYGVSFAVDTNENVYIKDYGRIQKFDWSGTHLLTWADASNTTTDSASLDLDGTGNLYVLSNGSVTRTVRKYNSAGMLLRQFALPVVGVGGPVTAGPVALRVDATQHIYAIAANGYTILKLANDGTLITSFGASSGTSNGLFTTPAGIAADGAGKVYVTDSAAASARLQTFTDSSFDLRVTTKTPANVTASGATLSMNTTDIGDIKAAQYSVDVSQSSFFTPSTNLMASYAGIQKGALFGSTGSGNGQLDHPNGVAHDSQGNIFVADSVNDRVEIFTSAGAYVGQIGGAGSGDGQFQAPYDVTVDDSNNLYVVDIGNNRVQKFIDSGSGYHYDSQFGSAGSGDRQFSYATNITHDGSGNVYVVDSGNYRIQKFDPTGNYLTQWGTNRNSLYNFGDIASDDLGHIYASVGTSHPGVIGFIEQYSLNGDLLATVASSGTGDGQMTSGSTLATDSHNNLYAVDGSGRLQVFDSAGGFITSYGPDVLSDSGDPKYVFATSLTVTGDGTIFASDYTGNYVQALAPSMSVSASGLTCGTTYHSRAKAVVGSETVYGDDVTFATSACLPAFAITTTSLPNGVTGVAYNQAVESNTPGTTFYFQDGSFPPGLLLNPDGSITGTPTTAGSYTFTVWATDSVHSDTKDLTIVIDEPTGFSITTNSLPDGTVGSSYAQTLQTDSVDPVTFSASVSCCGLPAGLSINSSGTISGTPTSAGTSTFTIDATTGAYTTSKQLSITVNAPVIPLNITTTSLPNGTVGATYSAPIETDSNVQVDFSLSSGSLPDGLSLGVGGLISGTATRVGAYSFTIQAYDGTSYDTQDFQVSIEDVVVVVDPPVTQPPTVTPDPPTVTDVTPGQQPAPARITRTTPITATRSSAASQTTLLALARRIPEPIAIGFPWLLLVLALLLVAIQYYQVHNESTATKRMQDGVARQKQLVEEQNNFVALSTHYLHTPLTVIEGEISLMVKAGTLTQAQATKLSATLTSLNAEAEAVLAQEEQHESGN